MPQELFTHAVLCRQLAGEKGIHLALLGRRDTVPHLGRSMMEVIEAVEVHILRVPEQHALDCQSYSAQPLWPCNRPMHGNGMTDGQDGRT